VCTCMYRYICYVFCIIVVHIVYTLYHIILVSADALDSCAAS